MPVLDALVELVTRGRCIPVHLPSLPRLESLVAEVHVWKECAANTFLTKNSSYSLLEVSLHSAHSQPLPYGGGTLADLCSRSYFLRGARESLLNFTGNLEVSLKVFCICLGIAFN